MNNKFDKVTKLAEKLAEEKPHLSVHYFCNHMVIEHSISAKNILPSIVLNDLLSILILLDMNQYVNYYITTKTKEDPKSNNVYELHIYQ